MKTIELTHKEAYLLWAIACWFDKPVTSTLKHKLADAVGPDSLERIEFDKRFETKIIVQLADKGSFIKERHPEWLKPKESNNRRKGK